MLHTRQKWPVQNQTQCNKKHTQRRGKENITHTFLNIFLMFLLIKLFSPTNDE